MEEGAQVYRNFVLSYRQNKYLLMFELSFTLTAQYIHGCKNARNFCQLDMCNNDLCLLD